MLGTPLCCGCFLSRHVPSLFKIEQQWQSGTSRRIIGEHYGNIPPWASHASAS